VIETFRHRGTVSLMPERRSQNRRVNPAVPEPLERRRERRQGDRRDSARKKTSFVVAHGDSRDLVEGEIGLGGASFIFASPLEEKSIVLELKLGRKTLKLKGTTVNTPNGRKGGVRHVQLDDLDTRAALSLAKWLDGVDD
jgi:hypothetical protein